MDSSTTGMDILRKIPRAVRSLMMRDVLRILTIDTLKDWERATTGIRMGINDLPSGRFMGKLLKDKHGSSSYSEEKDTIEALVKIALDKGWIQGGKKTFEHAQDFYELTDGGKRLLEAWDKNRSQVLAALVVEHQQGRLLDLRSSAVHSVENLDHGFDL